VYGCTNASDVEPPADSGSRWPSPSCQRLVHVASTKRAALCITVYLIHPANRNRRPFHAVTESTGRVDRPAPPFAGRGWAPPPDAAGIVLPLAVLERYVGEYKAASGFSATFRRDGAVLLVKPGNNPEVALLARSEIRFQDPRGPIFEFQLDGQGKVTGAILEQGTQRIPLERK
jgi:hypothetical protein